MKSLVLFISCIVGHVLFSQDYSSEKWHLGQVITTENDTLRGQIKYSFSENYILLKTPQSERNYTPMMVSEIDFTDAITGAFRVFKQLKIETQKDFYTPFLCEILLSGNVSLLSRDDVVVYLRYSEANPSINIQEKEEIIDYYVLINENVYSLDPSKRNLKQIFNDRFDEVYAFWKQNELKPYIKKDLIKIFEFYNTL